MLSRLVIPLLLALTPFTAMGQTEWPMVVAEGHIALRLPPGLEVDSAAMAFSHGEGHDVYTLLEGQPAIRAGSPEDSGESSNDRMRAANLIVTIETGPPGSYLMMGAEYGMSADELAQLDEEMRVGFIQQATQSGDLREIQWDGTNIIQLDQTQAITMRMTGLAGSGDDPYVINIYIIQNFDSIYYITMSYLESQAQVWIPQFEATFATIEFQQRYRGE